MPGAADNIDVSGTVSVVADKNRATLALTGALHKDRKFSVTLNAGCVVFQHFEPSISLGNVTGAVKLESSKSCLECTKYFYVHLFGTQTCWSHYFLKIRRQKSALSIESCQWELLIGEKANY